MTNQRYRRSRRLCALLSYLCLASVMAACTAFDPPAPVSPLQAPVAWSTVHAPPESAVRRSPAAVAGDAVPVSGVPAWWLSFSDPLLTHLIATGLKQNAAIKKATAERDAIVAGSGEEQLSGMPAANLGITGVGTNAQGPEQMSANISMGLKYELDLWGARGDKQQAAQAAAQAAELELKLQQDRSSFEIAEAYWGMALAEQERPLLASRLNVAQRLLLFEQARYRQGLSRADKLASARIQCSQAETATLENAVLWRQRRYQLTTLIGTPDQLPAIAAAVQLPAARTVPTIHAGLPAAVLRRRADVQASEWLYQRRVHLDSAQRKALYPTFSLTGSVSGASSAALTDWLSRPVSQVVAQLTAPLLQWPLLRYAVRVSDAERRAAHAALTQTWYSALREVEDGLANQRRDTAQAVFQTRNLEDATQQLTLGRHRYVHGLDRADIWLQQRLDSQAVQSAALHDRYQQAVRTAALYRALGGVPG